jgi:NADH dehydrogenase (ubiquinone) 1 alpha subcomplex subunit 12
MGLRVLLDGNLFTTVADPTRKGELVGEDHMGNRYYTNRDLPYVRSRWVIYKDKANYAVEQIPAEWHAWLNYINDFPPSQYQYKRPIYALEANKANDTKRGHQEAYNPKGNWHNPHQLTWLKYQPWQPPSDNRH